MFSKFLLRLIISSSVSVILFTKLVNAEPQILAVCGASEGFAAHTSNGLFAKKAGQQLLEKDGFSDSQIGLLMEKNGNKIDFDIAFINRGVTYKDRDEGIVQLINFNPDNQTFLLMTITNNKDNIRTYMFNLDKNSSKHVIWTDSQMGSSPRTRLMIANCD